MGMNRNQVSRYRDERWDCSNFTKTDHGEGRKFVKVSFKSVMIRTGTWILNMGMIRPEQWIECGWKTGKTKGWKKQTAEGFLSGEGKKRKKRKTSKKMKKVLKKGLLFFEQILWKDRFNMMNPCYLDCIGFLVRVTIITNNPKADKSIVAR